MEEKVVKMEDVELFEDNDYAKLTELVQNISMLESEFKRGDISKFDSNFLGLLDNLLEREDRYNKAIRIMSKYILNPGLAPTQIMLKLGLIKKDIDRDSGILKDWTEKYFKNHTKIDKRLLDLICD